MAELDAKMEDPEERPFPPGFLASIQKRRAELLGHVLTIWRFGRQNPALLKRGRSLGSFEAWCDSVRDPLLTLGCADPVERIAEVKGKDQRRRRIAEILNTWWARHESAPVKAADIHQDVRALIDPQGRGRQFIAATLEKMVGARVARFMLTAQRGNGKWSVATYAVRQTTTDFASDRPEHRGHRGHRGTDTSPNNGPDPVIDPIAGGDDLPPNEKVVL